MIENEVYINQGNLYLTEREKQIQKPDIPDRSMENSLITKEAAKQSNNRFQQTKKIKRTKSAGIF